MVFGGCMEGGVFVELMVVDGVGWDSWFFCEEIFGFVFLVMIFISMEEVIVFVNDLVYGLVVFVYMSNLN